jgi:hypothetical protein
MTPTEPIEPSELHTNTGTESQQQLVRELEEIAAAQLKSSDDEAVVLYDQEHPENETNKTESNEAKLEFERAISELRQRVMNAMVEFSQQIALINTEARGEEHLAIDVQFTKTIQAIRERVIDRVPELANQCWKVSDKAREAELESMGKLNSVVNGVRTVVVEAGQKTSQELEGLVRVVNEDSEAQRINSAVVSVDRSLVSRLQYAEAELSEVPKYYGDVEAQLNEMISAYLKLLNIADRPLSDNEQDEFREFFKEKRNTFLAELESKTRLERERIKNILESMHDYYQNDHSLNLQKSLDALARSVETA